MKDINTFGLKKASYQEIFCRVGDTVFMSVHPYVHPCFIALFWFLLLKLLTIYQKAVITLRCLLTLVYVSFDV